MLPLLLSISVTLSPSVFATADSTRSEVMEIAPHWEDPWLARDKLDHFWGSFVLAGMGTIWASQSVNERSIRGPVFGLGLSLTAGLGKEYMDAGKPGNRFSWRDMAANAAGAVLACLLLYSAAPR